MRDTAALRALQAELSDELYHGILPYWASHAVDAQRGGFVGMIGGDGRVVPDAPRAAVLNARILWTFSAAARIAGSQVHRDLADSAAAWFRQHFLDPDQGGVFWMLDAAGAPTNDRKHLYAQAFAIYGLSEHFRATGDVESLRAAGEIVLLVESNAADRARGGYHESFARDWEPLGEDRLGEGDPAEPRTMNSHLHLLEAYANLFRAGTTRLIRSKIAELLQLFLDRIIDRESGHLRTYFDEDWAPRSGLVSFGHDIEASWLLLEAAALVGDRQLVERVRAASVRLASAVLESGFDPLGGVYDFEADGALETGKEWWVQAEAIVGFLNAFELTRRHEYLEAALTTWAFTKRFIVDRVGGEWRRRVTREGAVVTGYEKVGPWKCPYHNARACMEVIERVARLNASAPPPPPLLVSVP